MKNIVFIGYVVDPERADEYTGISFAGNNMQYNILKYLAKDERFNITVISVVPNTTFPKDKRMFIGKKESTLCDCIKTYEVSYVNIPVIKQVSQCLSVIFHLKKVFRTISAENSIVLTFNMFPPIGIPAKWLIKKNIEVAAILADLPIDDAISRSTFGHLLMNSFDNIAKNAIKSLKHAIVLNYNAIKQYAPNSDYIIVDGGIDCDKTTTKNETIRKENNVLYCGSLNDYSGIRNLCNAMHYVTGNVFLDIYGSGELGDFVKECAKKDNRIRYHGRIPNSAILTKQKEAKFLINPRPINDPISMVTFPSKIFEYMMSGTPVISTKLSGFSSDYEGKVIFCGDSSEGIADAINRAMKMSDSEKEALALSASTFIVENKTWEKQTCKIADYLEGIIAKRRDS